jgi:N-acetylmuramoyl-L-alanine amidase
VPAGFNHLLALRIIGYDTRDSIAAFRAFKRHFMQDDSTRRISDADRRVLHCLVEKYW